MTSFLRTYIDPSIDLQRPARIAVVMPTTLRSSLIGAVNSVFRQNFAGPIHILIGIDAPQGDYSLVEQICQARPPHCIVQAFYPGYSTSVRHGGLHPARDGGVLRCVLTYLANSRHVAYLDDDNWWREDHLARLAAAVEGADWAYSLRWFVHPASGRPVCVDDWESVGPGKGIFAQRFGGFVDPSCLVIDKTRCGPVIPWWNVPLPGDKKGMSADRHVFAALSKGFRGVSTGEPTVFYRMDPGDTLHAQRLARMGAAYEAANSPSKHG